MMHEYQFCELQPGEDIAQHERLLYDAFVNRAKHGWLYDNYKISGDRMQAPFPYIDQLIFGIKKGKNLLASIALNINTREKLQLEYIGFSRKEIDTTGKYAEVLTLSSYGNTTHAHVLDIAKRFNVYLINKYEEYELRDVYGTTFKNKLLFYSKMGFHIIEEAQNTYGNVLLLRQRLHGAL